MSGSLAGGEETFDTLSSPCCQLSVFCSAVNKVSINLARRLYGVKSKS